MKKKTFMLSCIAAVAIATFVGKKNIESCVFENDALFAQNVEALSNGADGQNQYIVDCWNSITSEKGHTVYYCGDCSLLDGRRQITSRSGECVYTEKD